MTGAVTFEQELNDFLLAGAKQRNAPGGRQDRMLKGEESEEAMMVGVIQFYYHTVGFTNALRYLYARCDVPEMRDEIAEGLYEEETGGITSTAAHVDLYFRMAQEYGFSREKIEQNSVLLPEMAATIHWYHYAATALSVLEGLAVLNFAAEGQNVEIGGYPGAAGVSYRIHKERFGLSEEALVFSHVHSYADDEHCAVGARNLAERAATEEQKNRIRTAIRMTYDVWRYQGTMTRHKLSECWRNDGSAKFYI